MPLNVLLQNLGLDHDSTVVSTGITQVQLNGRSWHQAAKKVQNFVKVSSVHTIGLVGDYLVPPVDLRFRISPGANVSNESFVAKQLHAKAVIESVGAVRRHQVSVAVFQAFEERSHEAKAFVEAWRGIDFPVIESILSLQVEPVVFGIVIVFPDCIVGVT